MKCFNNPNVKIIFRVFCILQILSLSLIVLYQFHNYVPQILFNGMELSESSEAAPTSKLEMEEFDMEKQIRVEVYKMNLTELDLMSLGHRVENLTFLHLLRKLALFSNSVINQRVIKYNECGVWWVNPFSITRIQKVEYPSSSGSGNGNLSEYVIAYEAQPGRIRFEVVVQVIKGKPNATHPFVSDDFHFVKGRRLDPSTDPEGVCMNVLEEDRKFCSCEESDQQLQAAKNLTSKIRTEWSKFYPEHKEWPPDAPMLVSEYLTFTSSDFSKFPSKPKSSMDANGYCGKNVKLLIVVTCTPSNFERRETIRKTYGTPEFLDEHGARLIFVFAKSTNSTLQEQISEECLKFGDILEGNHVHSYQNNTLRILNFFSWMVIECQEALQMPQWILKMDDDYFPNIPLALHIAEANPSAIFIGNKECPWPKRGLPSSKFYTPPYMHMSLFYPQYLWGAMTLVQGKAIPALLKASINTPIINVDDVYFTGMLAQEIGVPLHSSRLIFSASPEREPSSYPTCWPKVMVNTWIPNDHQLMQHWNSFRNPPKMCFELNMFKFVENYLNSTSECSSRYDKLNKKQLM